MRGYGRLLILVMVLIFGGILACCPTGDGGTQPSETTTTPDLVLTAVLSSTSTTAARPSPTAENSPGPAALLFEDDFSDPSSGWEVGNYDEGQVGYEDGYYYVISSQEDKVMWGVANRSFGDADIELEATQFSAPDNDNNSYGAACRVQSNGDGYQLLVSGDGFYSISIVSGGSFTRLVDWTRSDVINQGNATNQIRAVCHGSRLALYCTGELLTETSDSTFAQGDIALVATTYESEATEVHFDSLKVYEPGAEGRPISTRVPQRTPPQTATLALIALNSTVSPGGGFFVVQGQVRNVSGEPLDDVLAVATVMDANHQFITYDEALIEYTTLMPGQVSPFSVMIDYNPAIEYYTVEFTSLWGEPIETRDDR